MTGGGNFTGTGSVFNNGVMNHTFGGLIFFVNGTKLENNGTYSMNTLNARLHLNGTTSGTINNNATGVITKAPAIAFAQIDGTAGTFKNEGTIFVPGGELEIGPMNFTSFSANALTGGTYTVDSILTGTALLDLQPANAGITTIGANATVNLIGNGASIQQLTSTFNTLNGSLKLSEGKVLNLNNLTMSSTSQLTFGLDDLASSNSKINLSGSLTADGLINIEDLGGLEIGVYDLISVSGLFTDNGLALGSVPPGFDGSIFKLTLLLPASGSLGGIVQLSVEIVPVPEPGSGCLLLLGLIALRKRNRRNARS
jgi:fibronectin-binding autotransporter adhesin